MVFFMPSCAKACSKKTKKKKIKGAQQKRNCAWLVEEVEELRSFDGIPQQRSARFIFSCKTRRGHCQFCRQGYLNKCEVVFFLIEVHVY